MLEQFLALASRPEADDIRIELRQLHDDTVMSLALLYEADMLITTRLNLYKLYSGNYNTQSNTQIVQAKELLRSRLKAAAAIPSKVREFRVEMLPFDGAGDIAIKVDTYVFQHICNNRACRVPRRVSNHLSPAVLSNARKHTQDGHVTLRFIGELRGMLDFAVADSGQGIPPYVASRLFREEVTTGAERGVGLGCAFSSSHA